MGEDAKFQVMDETGQIYKIVEYRDPYESELTLQTDDGLTVNPTDESTYSIIDSGKTVITYRLPAIQEIKDIIDRLQQGDDPDIARAPSIEHQLRVSAFYMSGRDGVAYGKCFLDATGAGSSFNTNSQELADGLEKALKMLEE